MHNINLSDKDIMIIDVALRVFRVAVSCAGDAWSREDLMDLVELSAEIARLAQADREERQAKHAQDQNRRE